MQNDHVSIIILVINGRVQFRFVLFALYYLLTVKTEKLNLSRYRLRFVSINLHNRLIQLKRLKTSSFHKL